MRLDEQNRILIAYTELVPVVWTKAAYDQALNRKKIDTTCRGGNGRIVEIFYDNMNDKYKAQICKVLGDPRVILGLIPAEPATNNQQHQRVPFNELTPKEMQVCNARYNLVKCCREYAELHGAELGITAAKEEFVKMVQDGYLCKESYQVIGKFSAKTLYRWDKEMKDGGDIMDALAPLRAPKKGTKLTDTQQALLRDSYCRETKPTYSEAYRMACRLWKLNGEELPTESICRRYLIDYENTNRTSVVFLREGVKRLNDDCLPYIERDPNSVMFMDMLVADGHVMNFDVAHPQTGRACRPTMVAWQDQRTHLILGFEMMVTENTMSVASSFRNACINAGRLLGSDGAVLPRSLYLDNGRAFKNKFFNKEADLETQVGGLFERLKPLGLEHVQYARPYNSQTKLIERSWADFTEIERMANSYRGTDITNKPASLHRNEVWHRNEREKAIHKNGLPTLWGAYKLMEWWLGEYNARVSNGKYLKGMSPIELAAVQIPEIDFRPRMLDAHVMDYMIMNSKTKKLTRNGFTINGVSYYNPIFTDMGDRSEEFIVRYDILNTDRVLVFREDGTFLCEAGIFFGSNIHAMAALGSDADRKKRNDALRQQQSIKKAAINRAISSHNQYPVLSELAAMNNTPHELLPPDACLQLQMAEIDNGPELILW